MQARDFRFWVAHAFGRSSASIASDESPPIDRSTVDRAIRRAAAAMAVRSRLPLDLEPRQRPVEDVVGDGRGRGPSLARE
jgi:hypothetical protein